MTAVILTLHTILVAALVGVVLLQRSEGGALGIGGGGGGSFMSGRGATNVLTRTTTILAAAFFSTSMLLAMLADRGPTQEEVIRSITGESATEETPVGTATSEDLLDLLGTDAPAPVTEPSTDEAAPIDLLSPEAAPQEGASSDAAEPENENGN